MITSAKNVLINFMGEYYTEQEICELLRIKNPKTLHGRISRGTNHPPYVEISRGVRMYPKRMFWEWVGKHPVMYEVKGAS